MQLTIERFLLDLAAHWSLSCSDLQAHWVELQASQDFLNELNIAIRDVPEFSGVHFHHVNELRVYRCMLYLFTRAFQPETFVETGVLNGFSSAFILLGMFRNGKGTLYSIDLPSDDPEILSQGTTLLPKGKSTGWVIPERLRGHHRLLLGPAQILLPEVLAQHKPLDAFLHDSDHIYPHMMFELSLAWLYLRPGGWLVCDNAEQNTAFADFARGVSRSPLVVASFDEPARKWKHGLLQKPI